MNNYLVKSNQKFDTCQIKGETIELWIPISCALIGVINCIVFTYIFIINNPQIGSSFSWFYSTSVEDNQQIQNAVANTEGISMYKNAKQKPLPSEDRVTNIEKQQLIIKNTGYTSTNNDHLIVSPDSDKNTSGKNNSAAALTNNIALTNSAKSTPNSDLNKLIDNANPITQNNNPILLKDCPSFLYFSFAPGSAVPMKQSLLSQIQELSLWVKQHPDSKILIEGYSDPTGSEESNLLLSHRRATSIKKLLIKSGLAIHQLNTRAFGEQEPLQDQPAVHPQKNRKVSVRIKDRKKCIMSLMNGDAIQ